MGKHIGQFVLCVDENGRRYWWGGEDGWKDPTEIGEDSVLTIDARHFEIGTVLTLSEPFETDPPIVVDEEAIQRVHDLFLEKLAKEEPNHPWLKRGKRNAAAGEEGNTMIPEWITRIIDGPSGLHAFEDREVATPNVPRDEAVAVWVIRCLANPECDGSADVLMAIQERREETAR